MFVGPEFFRVGALPRVCRAHLAAGPLKRAIRLHRHEVADVVTGGGEADSSPPEPVPIVRTSRPPVAVSCAPNTIDSSADLALSFGWPLLPCDKPPVDGGPPRAHRDRLLNPPPPFSLASASARAIGAVSVTSTAYWTAHIPANLCLSWTKHRSPAVTRPDHFCAGIIPRLMWFCSREVLAGSWSTRASLSFCRFFAASVSPLLALCQAFTAACLSLCCCGLR